MKTYEQTDYRNHLKIAALLIGIPLIGFIVTFEGIISTSIVPDFVDHRLTGSLFVLWAIWQVIFKPQTFLGISTRPNSLKLHKIANAVQTLLITFIILIPFSVLTLEINASKSSTNQFIINLPIEDQVENIMLVAAVIIHKVLAYLFAIAVTLHLGIIAKNWYDSTNLELSNNDYYRAGAYLVKDTIRNQFHKN